LEHDVTPSLRRVYDWALEHDVGMQQAPQRTMVVRLHDVVAPVVEGGHPDISLVCSHLLSHGPVSHLRLRTDLERCQPKPKCEDIRRVERASAIIRLTFM